MAVWLLSLVEHLTLIPWVGHYLKKTTTWYFINNGFDGGLWGFVSPLEALVLGMSWHFN